MSRYEQKVGKKYTSILLVGIVVILMILAFWLYQRKQPDNDAEIKVIEIPVEKAVPDFEKEELSNENLVKETFIVEKNQDLESVNGAGVEAKLPVLEESDDSFRAAVQDVSENLLDWFKIKDVIKKYIVIINGISQNQIIYKHRKFIKTPGKIEVKEDFRGLYLAKESYRRYDRFANAITSIDVRKGLALYRTFKPLFEQVYKEFAYPAEYRLEDIFMKAAASVIEAPIIEGRIALVPHSIRYKFADEKLESLNDVEKQMLRMGPENTKKIQAKLRQLVEQISILSE